MQVTVLLADGTAHPHTGHVDFTDSMIDTQTGTIRVRATVPNPDETLLPGQFVRVQVTGLSRRDAISVTQRANLPGPQGKFVDVLRDDYQAEAKAYRRREEGEKESWN